MDTTFHSYLTEALFANVAQESLFEDDEEEEKGLDNKNSKEIKVRLSSTDSFESIAYIDEDSGPEKSSKIILENDTDGDKIDYNVLEDDNDEVFQSSDPSSPTESTNSSQESFRTACNTLTRDDGINFNDALKSSCNI